MRPLYESEDDRANERRLAAAVSVAWKVEPVKLKMAYNIDYALLRDGRTVAVSEFKCRKYSMEQLDSMGGFMLSLHKWMSAKHLSEAAGVPFVVVVADKDGVIWHHRPTEFVHDGIGYGGRTDRGDGQDVEPVVLLRKQRFAAMEARLGG